MPKPKPPYDHDKYDPGPNNPDIFVEQSFKEAERKSNIDMLAFYYRERYVAFIKAGFSPSEAMEIIKARGIKI